MRRLLALGVLLVASWLPVADGTAVASEEEPVPVSTLLARADEFDQQVVTIFGEIVGDYGDRGDVVWVQVNDDPYVQQPLGEHGRLAGTNVGLSVRLEGVVTDGYGRPGAHATRGPLVRVTGIFRDLDPALGGLTFVEAFEVVLVEPARTLPEPGPDGAALVVGSVLLVAGAAALAHRRDLLRLPERS